jgi:segregation and condensation protein B
MQRRRREPGTLDACLARAHGATTTATGIPIGRRSVADRRHLLACDAAPGMSLPPVAEVDPGQIRSDEMARVEATLFLAREPLAARRLAKLARLADGTRARALVLELRRMQEAAGSALRVEQIAGGFQVLTRSAFGPWVRRLAPAAPRSRLSGSALETLAIVAYRQPVTRAEIESIRGAGSEEMLRQLLERDLVAIGGRAEELGRPNVYVTTRHFLAAFGLPRLEDLPPIETFTTGPAAADTAEESG